MDLRRGTMFRVNPIGSRILDLLDRGASLPQVVEQISADSGVAVNVVEADIQHFLDSLAVHGVLGTGEGKS